MSNSGGLGTEKKSGGGHVWILIGLAVGLIAGLLQIRWRHLHLIW